MKEGGREISMLWQQIGEKLSLSLVCTFEGKMDCII